MRIIAGEGKGRSLRTVRGYSVRPTADRVREALFSILLSRFSLAGATVLDLFAGTGAVGIEALSRGAAGAVFVEQDPRAVRVLRQNLASCHATGRSDVLPVTVRKGLRLLAERGIRFSGVFIDPPYGKGLAAGTLQALGGTDLLVNGAWVFAEHHVDDVLAAEYGGLHLTLTRRYGKTSVTLYMVEETPPVPETA